MSINSDLYLSLYANCIPVRGSNRSLICDLQVDMYFFVPNDLIDILEKMKKCKFCEVINQFSDDDKQTVNEYINFILEKNLGQFLTKEEKKDFPTLSLEWDIPYQVDNAIIDLDNKTDITWSSLSLQLDTIGCQALQFRLYDTGGLDLLNKVLPFFDKSRLRHINIAMQYEQIERDVFIELFTRFQRLNYITSYGHEVDEIIDFDTVDASVVFFKEKMTSHNDCGMIASNDMIGNIFLFTEAQLHNTCLNRKISIDVEGNIKNCPSMAQSFGNIRDTTLQEALDHPDFKKHWNINKDKIHVCKDCEFRYICTDCRAYIEDPADIYSKPLKCGYNPYTAEWSEWSTNPLKQKAMAFYGMESSKQV